jgi:two-component system response regulator HydG
MPRPRLLIFYPDPAGLALLASMLKSPGYLIEEATSDRRAVRLMERDGIDSVLAGVDPAHGDALELLRYIRRKHREVPVVVLFPRPDPKRSREALRLGATAVLKYPVPATELRAAVVQALEHRGPPTDRPLATATAPVPDPSAGRCPPLLAVAPGGPVAGPAPPPEAPHPGNSSGRAAPATGRVDPVARELGLIGDDPAWRQVLDLAGRIAATRASVLIVGEPGTGKSLLAQLMHSIAPDRQRPFVAIGPAEMAAEVGRPEASGIPADGPTDPAPVVWSDKLAQARGGTLYFDEVAALPVELQRHLLRELEGLDHGAGSGHPAPRGEVRFLASTGEDLPSLVEQGRFLGELHHRLGLIQLVIPPLRHRGDDIELLAGAFRARYAREFRKGVTGFTGEALEALRRHDWPGNVRELEGVVRRAVALCDGPRITPVHLAPLLEPRRRARVEIAPRPRPPAGIRPLKEALEGPEKRLIIEALRALDWNRQETATALGVNRATLYKKMRKYGLLIDEPM